MFNYIFEFCDYGFITARLRGAVFATLSSRIVRIIVDFHFILSDLPKESYPLPGLVDINVERRPTDILKSVFAHEIDEQVACWRVAFLPGVTQQLHVPQESICNP